jgi:hypothetical protein
MRLLAVFERAWTLAAKALAPDRHAEVLTTCVKALLRTSIGPLKE